MAEVLAELRRLNGRLDVIEKAVQPEQPLPSPSIQQGPPQPGLAPVMPPAADLRPQAQAPVPQPQQPLAAALGVLSAKCAACHQAGHEQDGGGFVMFDQSMRFIALDRGQLDKIKFKSLNHKMPPKNNSKNIQPLTDPENALISRI